MNQLVYDFLKRNNILQEVISFKRLHEVEDIDPIIANYGIYKPEQIEKVSVGDFVGIANIGTKNLLDAFSKLYGGRETYSSRADEFLKMDSEEMIKKAKFASIGYDKPCCYSYNKHCHFLTSNGRHRLVALAVLYQNELSRGVKKEILDEKYSLEARVEKLDYLKTYGNYIIHIATDGKFSLANEYDENYKHTGKSVIRDVMHNSSEVYTDEELLGAIKYTYLEDKEKFEDVYYSNQNFRNFVEKILNVKENKYGR